MTKLSYEDKINIYNENKNNGVSHLTLSKKYNVKKCLIQYLICLIDKHGIDILRTTKNKNHSKLEKEMAINRVLIKGESAWSVAIDIGLLNYGMLQNWISKYKENGYNIVERKRGRSPTMPKKEFKPKSKETIEEENERLRKENLYLKAELEYSKKLRAVVQARKNQQQKKK
jgi:transposase